MTNQNNTKTTSITRRIAIASLALGALASVGIASTASARGWGNNGQGNSQQMMGQHGGQGGGQGGGQKGGQRGGQMGGEFDGSQIERILGKIDATDEQKQKIRDIFAKAKATVDEGRREPGQMREQMLTLLKEPTLDRASIVAIRTSSVERRTEVTNIMANAFADALEVLTPDQRVKLADAMQNFGPRQ